MASLTLFDIETFNKTVNMVVVTCLAVVHLTCIACILSEGSSQDNNLDQSKSL